MKFLVHTLNTPKDILQTKFKYTHKQRAIPWIPLSMFEIYSEQNVQKLTITMFHVHRSVNEIYSRMKFQVDASFSFQDMCQTTFKYTNKYKANSL